MRNTLLNIILTLVLFTLLFLIIKEEITYKRYERYDWNCELSMQKDDAPLRIQDGYFSGNDFSMSFPNSQNNAKLIFSTANVSYDSKADGVKNQVLPDSLVIDWFSYAENQFYKAKNKLPYDKISKEIKANNLKNFDFILYFKKQGVINLYLRNASVDTRDSTFVTQIKAQKYDKEWEYGEDRHSDVNVMMSKCIITPDIRIKSNSKLKEIQMRNENDDTNYESGSDENARLKLKYSLKPGMVNAISFDLLNEKKYEDKMLSFNVSFYNIELSSILDAFKGKDLDLEVNINESDSIENIYFKDKAKKIYVNFKNRYTLNYNYDK